MGPPAKNPAHKPAQPAQPHKCAAENARRYAWVPPPKFVSDPVVVAEKENLCLYGLPNETWEVSLPAEEVPPKLPEPALGINFARDGMVEKDWLALVAVHSDAWLLAVALYFGALFEFDREASRGYRTSLLRQQVRPSRVFRRKSQGVNRDTSSQLNDQQSVPASEAHGEEHGHKHEPTVLMNRTWIGLEKSPERTVKSKIHSLGLKLLSRVKPSEIFLKSVTKDLTKGGGYLPC